MDASRPYIPDLLVQPPSVDFIENRLDKYSLAFATNSRYSPSQDSFVPPNQSTKARPRYGAVGGVNMIPPHDPSSLNHLPDQFQHAIRDTTQSIQPRPLAEPASALKFWDSFFKPAMKQFTELHPAEPGALINKTEHRIRDKNDWTCVFDTLEAAKQKYAGVDGSFKAGFRRVYRKMADNVDPVVRGTKLAPNSELITPVLGIIQVLLEAAKTAANVREEILGGFDELDMMFSQIELFLSIYRGDQNIEQASVSLIAATFHAVESASAFFVTRLYKRMFSAVTKGEDYQHAIIKSLQEMKHRSACLIMQAENSDKYEMSQAMRKVLYETSAWSSKMDSVLGGQVKLQRKVDDIKNIVKGLLDQFIASREAQEWHYAHERHVHALNLSRSSSPIPAAHAPFTQPHIDPQALLDLIDIPDLTSSDLEYIQSRSEIQVPPQERARAQQVVRTSKFRKWMVNPNSAQLLIHGNYDPRRLVSGLSLFCVSLAESIAERNPLFLPVMFFGGLHADTANDDFTGGRVMIESLICQLLCLYDFEATLTTCGLSEDLIHDGDIDELCDLFEVLVCHLPPQAVVFCLLDGMVYYEREEFEEDMGVVLVKILSLSDEQIPREQAAIKVLLTSPTRTTVVRNPFSDDCILSMDAMAGSGLVHSEERLGRELKETVL